MKRVRKKMRKKSMKMYKKIAITVLAAAFPVSALSACTPEQLLALQQIQQQEGLDTSLDPVEIEKKVKETLADNVKPSTDKPSESDDLIDLNDFEVELDPENEEPDPELEAIDELDIEEVEELEFSTEEEASIEDEPAIPVLPPVEEKEEDVEPVVINGRRLICARKAIINLRWGQLKFNKLQKKAQKWRGSIKVNHGIVKVLKPIKFEGRDKMVRSSNPSLVGWQTITKPHWDGVSLMVLAPQDGPEPEVLIRTGHGARKYTFSQLKNLHEVKKVDRLGNRVEIGSRVFKTPRFCEIVKPDPKPIACAPRALVKMRWGQFRFNKNIKRARKWPGQIQVRNGAVALLKRLKFEKKDRLVSNSKEIKFLTATTVHWDGLTAMLFADPQEQATSVSFKLPGVNKTLRWSQLDGFKARRIIDFRGNKVEVSIEELPSIAEVRPGLNFPCEFKSLPEPQPVEELPNEEVIDEFNDPESVAKPVDPVVDIDPDTLVEEPVVETATDEVGESTDSGNTNSTEESKSDSSSENGGTSEDNRESSNP